MENKKVEEKTILEIAGGMVSCYRIRDLSDGETLALLSFNPGPVKIPNLTVDVEPCEGDLNTEVTYSPDAILIDSPEQLAEWLKSMQADFGSSDKEIDSFDFADERSPYTLILRNGNYIFLDKDRTDVGIVAPDVDSAVIKLYELLGIDPSEGGVP